MKRMYEKLSARPTPICIPMPPLLFCEESETPIRVRIKIANELEKPVTTDSVTLPTDGKTYTNKELMQGYTSITCKNNILVRTISKTLDIEVYVKVSDDAFVKIII